MPTPTERLSQLFTPEQFAQVGGASLYVELALTQFSQQIPRLETTEIVLTDSPILPLPADWDEGFSTPYRVMYPVASAPVSAEPTQGSDGLSIAFGLGDWTFSSGFYVLELEHGLESTELLVQFKDGITPVFAAHESVTSNKIRVLVSTFPDGRFVGTARIERTV